MVVLLIVILCQVVMHTLEARHDYYVINGADPNKTIENRAWHEQDSMLWFFVHLTLAFVSGNLFILLTGLSIRLLVLQVTLNELRGLPMNYLSIKGIDGFFRRYIGLKATLPIKAIIILFSIYLVYEAHF